MSAAQNLKLKDVYSCLLRGNETAKRYCPQCGHKTLRKGRRYLYEIRKELVIWACTHNMQPRTHRGKPHNLTPCDLVIAFDDRDAEIDDYGGVLGLMSQIHVPQIQQWLLKNNSDIHARGLDVLYEGPLVDVVRRRDGDGVGVALFWRGSTWDKDDSSLFTPNNTMFEFARKEACGYVDYQGFKASYLFQEGISFDLWTKDSPEDQKVFKGSTCGKRMAAQIVEFVKGFELAIPKILMECKSEVDRWAAEERDFKATLNQRPGGLRHMAVRHYCGERRSAALDFGVVRPYQAAQIEDLLKTSITFQGLCSANRIYVSMEEAMEIEKILGVEYRVSLRTIEYGMRFNLDMAMDMAAILHPVSP